jgi:hypothetical protein
MAEEKGLAKYTQTNPNSVYQQQNKITKLQ